MTRVFCYREIRDGHRRADVQDQGLDDLVHQIESCDTQGWLPNRTGKAGVSVGEERAAGTATTSKVKATSGLGRRQGKPDRRVDGNAQTLGKQCQRAPISHATWCLGLYEPSHSDLRTRVPQKGETTKKQFQKTREGRPESIRPHRQPSSCACGWVLPTARGRSDEDA